MFFLFDHLKSSFDYLMWWNFFFLGVFGLTFVLPDQQWVQKEQEIMALNPKYNDIRKLKYM